MYKFPVDASYKSESVIRKMAVDNTNKYPYADFMVSKNLRQFATFPSPNAFENYLTELEELNRNFFECFHDNERQRFYIDVDVHFDAVQVDYKDKILWQQAYEDAIRLAFLAENYNVDLVTCDSSKEGELFSWHFIARNIYFNHSDEIRQFVRDKVYPLLDYEKAKQLDFSVYRKFGQFRLAGCCKLGTNRIKKIISVGHTFEDTLITHVTDGYVIYISQQEKIEEINIKPPVKEQRPIKHPTFVSTKVDNNILSGYISNIAKGWCDENHMAWVHTYRGIYGNMMYFNRTAKSYCRICHRDHEHDNTFIVKFERDGKLFHHCWHMFNGASIEIGQLDKAGKRALRKLSIVRKIKNATIPATLLDALPVERMNKYSKDTLNVFEKTETLCVKAGMGIGKTVMLTQFIEQHAFERVVIISFRRTFTAAIKARFPKFESYEDILWPAINITYHPYLIIQVESLHRLDFDEDMAELLKQNSLLVLDESESILSQFGSELFKHLADSFNGFKFLLKFMSNVIAMDANMGDRTYRTIDHFRPNTIFYHNNTYKRYTDHVVYLTYDKNEQDLHMMNQISCGKKIVLATSSCAYAQVVGEKVGKIISKDKVLVICSKTPRYLRDKIFADVNATLTQYDVVIYTPTLTAGVSFEAEHFDAMYCYFTDKSCDGLACDQMMGRIRNIKSKTYYMCIDMTYCNLPITPEKLKAYIIRNRSLLKQELGVNLPIVVDYDDVNGKVILPANDYLNLWLENIIVTNRYRNDFLGTIIPVLLERGCILKVLGNDLTEDNIAENRRSLIDARNQMIDQDSQRLAAAPNLTHETYEPLINKPDKNPAEVDAIDKYKLATFYNIDPNIMTTNMAKNLNNINSRRHYKNLNCLSAYNNISDALTDLKSFYDRHVQTNNTIEELSSRQSRLYKRNAYANEILVACGFTSIFDNRSKLTKDTITNNLLKAPHLFTTEKINDYKMIYGIKDINKKNKTIETFNQHISIVNSILNYQYGYTLGTCRSKNKPDALIGAPRETYMIIPNPNITIWKYKAKFNYQGYDDDFYVQFDDKT